MWLILILSTVLSANSRRLSDTRWPTTSPSGVPSQKPTDSPTFPHPSKRPTSDPTNYPTYEWGPWGECMDCSAATRVPSLYDLPSNVCGCRESNRTCEVAFADYDCSSSGVEIKVDTCEVDGLSQEITCTPTDSPTYNPSQHPSIVPTLGPTTLPTMSPSSTPTVKPTRNPTTLRPTLSPSSSPTPDIAGELIMAVSVTFHGWPSSKSVMDSLAPFSSVTEVEAEKIDIISWNYTSTSPYEMSVLYELYLLNNDDVLEARNKIESINFGNSLSGLLLESWDRPSNIFLTVFSVNIDFATPRGRLQMDQWAVAFVTFGCFLFLTVSLVAILACLRSNLKKKFKKGAQDYTALLNKTKSELECYNMGAVNEEALHPPTITVSSSSMAPPSLAKSESYNIYSSNSPTGANKPSKFAIDTFVEVKDLVNSKQPQLGRSTDSKEFKAHSGLHKRKSSTVIRQEHHEFRKQVLRGMKSDSLRINPTPEELIENLKKSSTSRLTDQDGDVSAPLGSKDTLKAVESEDTLVTEQDLVARSDVIKRESTRHSKRLEKTRTLDI